VPVEAAAEFHFEDIEGITPRNQIARNNKLQRFNCCTFKITVLTVITAITVLHSDGEACEDEFLVNFPLRRSLSKSQPSTETRMPRRELKMDVTRSECLR